VTSVKVAREELERLIALCEAVAKSGTDPYNLDVKSMLSKLRSILEKFRNAEVLVLDAETLYRIAVVVALQHKWLKDRANSLFLDSQVIALKIASSDKKSLAAAFVSSWRPILYTEQLTIHMLNIGLEHFLSLPTRGEKTAGEMLPSEGLALENLSKTFSQYERLEEDVRRIHGEMLGARDVDGSVDYLGFVNAEGPSKVVERAFLTAFVVSEGYADLKKNPLSGEIRIIPYTEKVKRSSVSSLVVTVKGGELVV